MLDKDLVSSVFSLVDHGLHVNWTAVQCQLQDQLSCKDGVLRNGALSKT